MLFEAHLKVQATSMGQSTYQEKLEALVALRKGQLEREVVTMHESEKTSSELGAIHNLLKAWL